MELLSFAVTLAGVELSSGVLLALLLPVLFLLYNQYVHSGYDPKTNPLVWSWVPHLRSALQFGKDPNSYLAQCRKQYGSIFTLNLGGRHITFVTDPRSYPLITRARDGLSFSVVAGQVGQQVLGQTRDFYADGELDERVHAQYTKYLTGAHLDELTRRFQLHLESWLAQHYEKEVQAATAKTGGAAAVAPAGQGIKLKTGLLDLVTRSVFSASTKALFGELLVDQRESGDKKPTPQSFGPNFSDDFYQPSRLLSTFQAFDHVFPLMYGGLPHFLLRGGVQAREDMACTIQTLREESCEFFQARKELIVDDQLTKRPDEKAVLDDFGRDQLGMLWALNGNTIPAAFWVLFNLLKHPSAQKRVVDEVDGVLRAAKAEQGSSTSDSLPIVSRDTLKSMRQLDAAISESLRLATGSMMMRVATEDLTLDLPTGPLPLKKGANIAIYPYITHHDPELFPNPEQFDLDRWTDRPVESATFTNVHGEKVAGAYMPFGSGISMCPGRHFARNEIKLFLCLFLNLFELEVEGGAEALETPGYLLSRAGLGIFPPAKDVEVTFRPKAQQA